MLKRYTALLFIGIAYTILLGHSIIPHHHHDNNHDLTEHHQTGHHHDSDEESNDLSHLFSHFIHAADGFTATVNYNFSSTFSKQLFLFSAVLPDNFSLYEFLIPPLLVKSPAENFNYTFLNTCTFGLRAPPAFVIA